MVQYLHFRILEFPLMLVEISIFLYQELLVLADSRFGTLQRLYFDWFQPGGLLRPVEAMREPVHVGC